MTTQHAEISTDSLLQQSVAFDDTVFCFGADYRYLRPELIGLDRQKNLGLGSVLFPTPPWWVVARAFRIARRMVSNEDYLRFWNARDVEDESELPFIERVDLWTSVWEQAAVQNLVYSRPPRIGSDAREMVNEPFVEHYDDCTNYVQAAIKSFRYEAYRLFDMPFPAPNDVPLQRPDALLEDEDPDAYEQEVRRYLITYVFAGMQYLFRAFYEEEQLAEAASVLFQEIEPGDAAFVAQFVANTEELEQDITEVCKQFCDPKFRSTFGFKANEIEIVQILQRVRRSLRKEPHRTEQLVRVFDVFFPRVWDDPATGITTPAISGGHTRAALKGAGGTNAGAASASAASQSSAGGLKGFNHRSRGGLKGGQVPWEIRPVMGVSLYEALAYTTWLTQFTYDDGYLVKLPSEAEFERCASWPQHGWQPDGEMTLKPQVKSLFPWEPPFEENGDGLDLANILDYSAYFGDQAKSLDGFYYQNKARMAKLLEDTARHVVREDGTPDRIEMLLGFGWQWTEDRYQETEDGYNRFKNNHVNLRSEIRATIDGQRIPVFDYFAPGFNPDWSYFVCRGAPEILGGPGTSTRRFALLPLRGYRQVGFRWAMQEVKEV